MKTFDVPRSAIAIALASAAIALTMPAHAAPDAAAAEALARQNNCFKCHSATKEKDGPSFAKTAAKYKGKPDAEARLITHLTTGEKAKFSDGHEEEHKVIKVKDEAELKNIVAWILAQ
jgi:cytochrome c